MMFGKLKISDMVIYCKHRDCLSRDERLSRSYYEILRDELDLFVLGYARVDSYNNFLRLHAPYPFVAIRELKPRARIPSVKFGAQNSFLIIFSEGFIHRQRYGLTHFHVRIDWSITDASEALARKLRYVSKGLCEKGDEYSVF